ncbi:MAG: hypothetical protein WCK55_20740 [Verrucomicrobiota bacterium]
MSPSAGDLLVEQITPRLRTLVPKSVKPVGAEDPEELLQDAITIAAQMLHRVEEQGKSVTPGNIAYYAVLHMRSGRRSQGSSHTDTMGIGTQLDGRSSVLSFEEEVGYDPELDEPITLGQLLASEHEDPSMEAARNLDWELFIRTHDYRYGIMIKGIAEGQSLKATAERSGHLYMSLYGLKEKMAEDVRDYLGDAAIAESVRTPRWKASIAVDREKASCRADRRRR